MVSKEEFEAYESVRQSGATNMFDLRNVTELSGLTRKMCLEIMDNYSELRRQYNPLSKGENGGDE